MRIVIITCLGFIACYSSCWAQPDEAAHSLFFTNPYRNPAIANRINTSYADFQALKCGTNFDFESYSGSGAVNVGFPSSPSNAGLFYQFEEQPWVRQQKIGLNLGHRLNLNDSSTFHLGVNMAWLRQKAHFFEREEMVFTDQFSPRMPWMGPTYETLAPLEEFSEPQPRNAFTENLGVWYRSPRYEAGISFENFLTIADEKAPFVFNRDYPLAINAVLVRHFYLGQFRVSPVLDYHFQTRDVAVHYSLGPGTNLFHQVKPGLLGQFKERYFLGFKTGFEFTRAYGTNYSFNNYQVHVGIQMWDQLLVRVHARFPETRLFGRYNEAPAIGFNLTWFLPDHLFQKEE